MQFLVIPNSLKKEAVEYADFIREEIEKTKNICVQFDDINRRICDESDRIKISGCDVVIVIGGDGTVLRTARLLSGFNLPIWCVNFGHIGYLSDCQPADFDNKLEKVISKNFTVENRTTIECEIVGEKENLIAYNEVVIHRASISRALKIDFSLNEELLRKIRADGVIISTPTGSTAYNVSAGGPVLSPTSTDIAVTAICPVPNSFTYLIAKENDEIHLTVHLPSMEGDDKNDTPLLVLDGLKKYHLSEGSIVNVRKGAEILQLIKTDM